VTPSDRIGKGLAVAGLVWSLAVASPALGATLVLGDGEELDGTIIDATRNTVIVRPELGGMRQIGLTDIREVRVDVDGGRPVIGRLISWADGVYEVQAGNELIWVTGDGRMLGAEAVPAPSEVPAAIPAVPDTTAPQEVAPAAPSPPAPETEPETVPAKSDKPSGPL
jgi:hypothetical protein